MRTFLNRYGYTSITVAALFVILAVWAAAYPERTHATTCAAGAGTLFGSACVIFLTSGSSFTVPADWNSANNTIEAIGAGGGGGGGIGVSNKGGAGGGGGAYSKIVNLTLTPSGSATYNVGGGGAGGATAGGVGGVGGDTYFNGGSCAGASVCAKGGSGGWGGGAGAVSVTPGGLASSGVGNVGYNGGYGGTDGNATNGGGGGGAAGPGAAGAWGGNGYAVGTGGGAGGGGADGGATGTNGGASVGGAGGNGPAGSGGGAASSAGTNGGGGGGGTPGSAGGAGGAGTEWDATHGAGGGGGGGGSNGLAAAGGAGGNYGGGGGGGDSFAVGGNGAAGLIVVTYYPTNFGNHTKVTFNGTGVTFSSSLNVGGALAKGSGTFLIDHPLDPREKLLYHSFVESPDPKNIYDGIATLDANGEVTISLPDYFDALNTDVRYQFFAIDEAMPDLFIKTEEKDNQFTIGGGVPGGTISWQITGVRHDPYILKHPIIVEQFKTEKTIVTPGECLFEPLCK